MKILIATSEMVPFSKTGGLADVAGALARALGKLGHEVRAIVPFYNVTKQKGFGIEVTDHTFSVPMSDREEYGEIFQVTLDNNVKVYFVGKAAYYERDQLYGTSKGDYADNAERFIFFSKAALELCRVLDYHPDVIHCNDWQTGLIPIYIKTLLKNDPIFEHSASFFTIHNIAFQGLFWHLDLHLTNLPWELFTPEGIEFYGKLNLLKAGILSADIISTVSPRYAREIQTSEFGCRMEGMLRKHSDRLFGVLNGVDYEEWNPETDTHIVANYSSTDLSGKARCKADVLGEFGLPSLDGAPLLGVVSRLTDQKGFDILTPIMDDIAHEKCQFVLLGTGEEEYERLFAELAQKYPGIIGVRIGFSNELAHKIEAGADIFLMPSRYEPCGLNQMYSLKYGTVPLVRATGGLDDTIVDYPSASSASGNGFKFEDYDSETLYAKIREAFRFYEDKDEWSQIMQNGMMSDFSWDACARKYEELYEKAVSLRNSAESILFNPSGEEK